MIIRQAKPDDIQAILNVLKASLGESSSKKSEEVWRYKHIDNPFGESLVLLAEENSEIIGVRAFMRWKWQIGNKSYSAFRAVDTATHPEHQGKGIFKKLTLKALEIAKNDGDHFVFNTPNSQSKPGYIKMGWEEIGKLPISVIPQSPLRFFISNNSVSKNLDQSNVEIHQDLINQNHQKLVRKEKLFTPKTKEYLQWRYIDNKIQTYFVYSGEGYFIAAYLKKRGKMRELRITELIFEKPFKRAVKKYIFEMSKKAKAQIITVSRQNKLSWIQITADLGPVLTFKNINCGESEKNKYLTINSWNYTLGDLELF